MILNERERAVLKEFSQHIRGLMVYADNYGKEANFLQLFIEGRSENGRKIVNSRAVSNHEMDYWFPPRKPRDLLMLETLAFDIAKHRRPDDECVLTPRGRETIAMIAAEMQHDYRRFQEAQLRNTHDLSR